MPRRPAQSCFRINGTTNAATYGAALVAPTMQATQSGHITIGAPSPHPLRVVNQGNTDWTIGNYSRPAKWRASEVLALDRQACVLLQFCDR